MGGSKNLKDIVIGIAKSPEAASDEEAASLYLETLRAMIEEGGFNSQKLFKVNDTDLF